MASVALKKLAGQTEGLVHGLAEHSTCYLKSADVMYKFGLRVSVHCVGSVVMLFMFLLEGSVLLLQLSVSYYQTV